MKKSIILPIFLICCYEIVAQTIPLPKIQSPNTSSFGLFGEIPVSYFTGTPDISIPLYTVTAGSINVPITLRYHPALVKPNEHPGWTGLGWDLQCTGSITRVMNYWNDEYDYSALGAYYPNGYHSAGSTKVSTTNWTNEAAALRGIFFSGEVNDYDVQADEFIFNFLGYSGKFFYTSVGWKAVSDHNIKVEINGFIDYNDIFHELQSTYFTPNIPTGNQTRMFMGFTLTTDDGTKYVFGNTSTSSLDAIEFTSTYSETNESNKGLLASTWYLKKITDKYNNEVSFTYSREYPICKLSFYSFYVNNACYYDWFSYNGWGLGTGDNVNTAYHDGNLIIPVYLREIIAPNLDVTFTTSYSDEKKYSDLFTRYKFDNDGYPNGDLELDLPYLLGNINNLKWEQLNTITIKDGINSTIRIFNFLYNNPSDKRLCLGLLEEKDASGITGQKNSFEYNDINSLPDYGGDQTDHWGYYNTVSLDGHSFYTLNTDRNTNINAVKKGLLVKMIYPTGGYTTFDWEAHDYSQYVNIDRLTPGNETSTTYAGSCRIREIKNYPDAFSNPIVKTYYYLKNYTNGASGLSSSGFLNGKPQYVFDIPPRECGDGQCTVSHHLESVHSLGSFSFNTDGSHIGYSEITEKIGDGSFTKYYYTNLGPDLDGNSHYDKESGVIGWVAGEDRYIKKSELKLERGKINGIFKYNYTNTCLEKTLYHYRTDAARFNNFIRRIEHRNSYGCLDYDLLILASTFKEYTYNYHVVKEDHTLYDQNGLNPIKEYIYYDYTSLNQLREKKFQNEDESKELVEKYVYPNDVSTSTFQPDCIKRVNDIQSAYNDHVSYCNTTYPFDPEARDNCVLYWWSLYPEVCHDESGNFLFNACLTDCQINGPSADQEASAIYTMIEKNIIDKPIQLTKSMNGSIFSSEYTKYLTQDNLTLPRTSYALELTTAISYLPDYLPSVSNQGIYIKSDLFNSQTEQAYYDSYDDKGNILQFHKKNDLLTSYIWGYNQAYPVVKAENVDYATLNTAVSSIQSDLQGYLKNTIEDITTDTQKNAWKSFNTALRSTASLNNVHITTYTYKPLVGMTSRTDPNGSTTYYDYDSFGRLKLIRDKDGNILKTYDYHYKE